MKNSDPSIPGAIRALFAFFACSCLFILALGSAWSSFQKTSQAAPSLQNVTEAIFIPPRAPSGSVEATESHDAVSAQTLAVSVAPYGVKSARAGGFGSAELKEGVSFGPVRPKMIPVSLPDSGDVSNNNKLPGQIEQTPRLAIIIDDMGLARKNSRRVVDLPSGLTLSYLPYAEDIQAQVNDARAKGHEIMLHLPMEPFDHGLYPGPGALTMRLSPDELQKKLRTNLNAFSGYVGINNHMGSRLTSTDAAMQIVMDEIDRRGVYFVDSWTSPRSVAYVTAAMEGIPRARRDVFLDHYEGESSVWSALKQAEYLARRYGSAVVIGHPKNDTINVLRAWLPGAMKRGVQIVPMSRLIYRGSMERDPVLMADAGRRGHGVKNKDRNLARLSPAAGE